MTWISLTLRLVLAFCITTLVASFEKDDSCNALVELTGELEYNISSTGYPEDSYSPGESFTWCIISPENTTLSIYCDDIDIPKSDDCETNALTFTYNEKSSSYCGSKDFSIQTGTNETTIKLHSSKKSRGGKFFCRVEVDTLDNFATRAIVYDNCDCGYSYRLRIVGGNETGVNEFPFMAGLVDNRRGAIIVCGAVIISPNYVLTVNHCLGALIVDQTAVVVGEHNTSTGSETSATRVIRASRFIPYPYYNSDNNQYDIALIQLASPITYNMRVGPVCLPFMSRNWDLTGEVVTALGWGTTEFGGPRSKVLKKTNLDVINISECQKTYGAQVEPYTQLCTYRANTDACQYDSGGPELWFNYYTNRYEVVALISYGRGCAQPRTPSINTKVAPFLQWILDNTQSETYCYKSQS